MDSSARLVFVVVLGSRPHQCRLHEAHAHHNGTRTRAQETVSKETSWRFVLSRYIILYGSRRGGRIPNRSLSRFDSPDDVHGNARNAYVLQ